MHTYTYTHTNVHKHTYTFPFKLQQEKPYTPRDTCMPAHVEHDHDAVRQTDRQTDRHRTRCRLHTP